MTDMQQSRFDGWAIVDVLGHQRYVGYVTTEAFGQAVLFRIDVPALEPRERVTKRPGYDGDRYLPAGTTVIEGAVAGYTKFVGSGSIYTITPCTKDAALAAVEEAQRRPWMSVVLPDDKALPSTTTTDREEEERRNAADGDVDPDDDEDDPDDTYGWDDDLDTG